ncbi:GNAT family N-acetyltransferase [Peribacillus acanthi]|uniref:GNAT family N-acetyltransferase n=1 Tax=Peribacillus acanthi TaxID=2171554 RepID=UPI000D3ED5CA|nr:GNAT family N-acetyltransferase [Peribacillus acanthi]
MMRKLRNNDHNMIIEYLKEEPSLNLFIIGDIEALGYDNENQDLWGEFNEKDELIAVLLRYYNSYIPYAKGDFNALAFAEIILNDPEYAALSGVSKVVEKLEPYLEGKVGKKQVTYFCECTKDDFTGASQKHDEVKLLSLDRVDELIALRASIDEFIPNPRAKEMIVKGIESHTGRTYYIEVNNKMAATASTTAENSISAMIVGVCTSKDYRRQGLASVVMQQLVQDVLEEDKVLCLFYDNPEAGRIYKRLGFRDIGMWTMFR